MAHEDGQGTADAPGCEGPKVTATAAVPPFKTGDYDMADEVYDALEPLDGFPKGSRGGPRIYRYGRWWVVVSTSDFGDLLVGPWGVLHA